MRLAGERCRVSPVFHTGTTKFHTHPAGHEPPEANADTSELSTPLLAVTETSEISCGALYDDAGVEGDMAKSWIQQLLVSAVATPAHTSRNEVKEPTPAPSDDEYVVLAVKGPENDARTVYDHPSDDPRTVTLVGIPVVDVVKATFCGVVSVVLICRYSPATPEVLVLPRYAPPE